MNLQLCVPYQPCIYGCPMCVARGHRHEYKFDNLYATDKKQYLEKLADFVKTMEKGSSVVLTGECDPTQDMPFLKDVIKVIRKVRKKDLIIELQTKNYDYEGGLDIDVLSYSIVSVKDYLNAWKLYKDPDITNRMVVLLVREFNFLNNENFNAMGFQQVTFKVLQYGENDMTNLWIQIHEMKDTDIEKIGRISRPNVSIRLDRSCQTATGRYYVFRSDGNIYESWEEGRKC